MQLELDVSNVPNVPRYHRNIGFAVVTVLHRLVAWLLVHCKIVVPVQRALSRQAPMKLIVTRCRPRCWRSTANRHRIRVRRLTRRSRAPRGEAIANCQFIPAMRNGVAAQGWVMLNYIWTLHLKPGVIR